LKSRVNGTDLTFINRVTNRIRFVLRESDLNL